MQFAPHDLGSPDFVEDLRETEDKVPGKLEDRRWSMRYELNLFGSMRAGSGINLPVLSLHQQRPKAEPSR
jgi:hypothetical protein